MTKEILNESNIERKMDLIADEENVRIDVYLSNVIDRSRSFCSNLINEKLVEVNEKTVKPSFKISLGDVINIIVPKEKIPDITPKKIDFKIVYECDDFAVIDKPAGLTVHPAPGNYDNTLVNGLIYKFNLKEFEGIRPGIVHRLDKDTSGLMVIAKHGKAKELLSGLFEKREVYKAYFAVCYGNPSWNEQIVELYMGRSSNDRKKMTVRSDGKFSKSQIKVVWRGPNIFLAKVKIFTGRTHQIRLHMSYLGFPIIGDKIYGNKLSKKINFNRQALHSYFLKFINPFNEEEISCVSNLPDDIFLLLKKFNFEWSEDYCKFDFK